MNDKEYEEHRLYNLECGNKNIGSKRSHNVNIMIDEIAWSNGRRENLPSDQHTCQEHLDNFRNRLCSELSEMNDCGIPETIKDMREFVFTRWDRYVDSYKENDKYYISEGSAGQTCEQLKNSTYDYYKIRITINQSNASKDQVNILLKEIVKFNEFKESVYWEYIH